MICSSPKGLRYTANTLHQGRTRKYFSIVNHIDIKLIRRLFDFNVYLPVAEIMGLNVVSTAKKGTFLLVQNQHS